MIPKVLFFCSLLQKMDFIITWNLHKASNVLQLVPMSSAELQAFAFSSLRDRIFEGMYSWNTDKDESSFLILLINNSTSATSASERNLVLQNEILWVFPFESFLTSLTRSLLRAFYLCDKSLSSLPENEVSNCLSLKGLVKRFFS